MTCRLCELDKKLIKAHVIPRSFHRITPGAKGPTRLMTNLRGRYTQNVPKGVYDPTILCGDCERRFSNWDDYGNNIFLRSWDKFKKIMDRGECIAFQLPDYDYQRLKLFFLSVLWRASVSAHVMFERVDLGPREPALRESILKAEPGDIDHFGVVLQAFDQTDVGMLDPHPARLLNRRFYKFYVAHVIAFIKVDSQTFDDALEKVALGPDRPLIVFQKRFLGSPERHVMRKLVVADYEKKRRKRGSSPPPEAL